MKLLLASILLFAQMSFAAPFLVSDADPTGSADKCVYQEGTQSPVITNVVVIPPALTGGCKADLASVSAGTHNIQVWFMSTVWGVTSAKVPFQYTRPSATATGPQNLQLVP